MIKIYLDNINCKLTGEVSHAVLAKMDKEMSYNHPGYQFMSGGRGGYGLSGKYGGWDGRVRLLTESKAFPIGLLKIAERILSEESVEYEVVDARPILTYGRSIPLKPGSKYSLRDYQIGAIKAAKKNKSGIIRMATGAGKTFVITSLVAEFNIPTVIYVIGIELLYQMRDTLRDAYGIEAGIVGGGVCNPNSNVTIMTIWSAASAFNKKAQITDSDITPDSNIKLTDQNKREIKKLVTEAQLFIFDECQYAASETLQFLHKASFSAKHRFLFSGTPWRDTGDDILIEAVSGPKIYDLNATKLINEGHLVPPDIHFLNVPVMRNVGSNYHDVYKNYIVENDERNNMTFKATKKLVDAGKKVLVLIVRVPHGKKLMDLLSKEFETRFLDGAKSTKNRLETIQDMKDGKVQVLIASKIFDQGVDIPELDALVLAGSGKSSGRALQRIGRVIRKAPGKKKAIVVEFYDNCKYLKDHSEARIKIYKSEKAFNIIMPKKQVLQNYPDRKPIEWD